MAITTSTELAHGVRAAIEVLEEIALAAVKEAATADRPEGVAEWVTYDGTLRYRGGDSLAIGPWNGDIPAAACALVAGQDPAAVLRRCAADRKLVAEVASWRHTYIEEDTWYSCAVAVDPEDPEQRPGGGSAKPDDTRPDTCDCGLEGRRLRILRPLAEGYGITGTAQEE
ncbi:DUF6221 family protein [Actinosynnema sp. NPDC023587]|uniref:DUF6221 family protein n=1 Tax=Actinosynnema sp. NPDC023587 TaxID=3154695 RepID=UPI0033C07CC6